MQYYKDKIEQVKNEINQIDDIAVLENRLKRVNMEIEKYENELRKIDEEISRSERYLNRPYIMVKY